MAKADQRFGQRDGSDQNFDYMFKLLIIGNSSVGKTSFLFRYADDSFSNSFVSTVGIDFKVKTVYRNEKRIKLQIWVSSRLSTSCKNDSSRMFYLVVDLNLPQSHFCIYSHDALWHRSLSCLLKGCIIPRRAWSEGYRFDSLSTARIELNNED